MMAPARRPFRAFPFSLVVVGFLLIELAVSQCDIPPLALTISNITVTSDGLGVTRGIELGVGSPHQVFAFRAATTLNNTRINNVLNCGSASNDSCIGGLGGGFDSGKSTSYTVSIKSQWNGSAIDQEDSTGAYVYFNDDVGFQSQGDVDGFPLVQDSEVWGGSQSGLPLGTNSSFLRAVVSGKVAPSEVFGLWPGSRGINPRDGMLTIGGYDQARVSASTNFTKFPVGNWTLKRACPLQVTVTNLTYAGSSLMNASEGNIDACIEPSIQRFAFPPSVATTFGILTGQNSTLYPKGMQYNVSSRPSGNLTITLSNGYQTTIPNDELFAPLRGSDKNGRYAITNDSILEAFVGDTRKQSAANVDNSLGGLFLTFNYLMVDYSKGEFGLAPAVTDDLSKVPPKLTTVCTPKNSSSPSSPSPSSTNSNSKTNVGAIAGGVVGGVAGAALIAAAAFFLLRRRKNTKSGRVPTELSAEPTEPTPVQRQMSEMESPTTRYEMPTTRHNSVRDPKLRIPEGYA